MRKLAGVGVLWLRQYRARRRGDALRRRQRRERDKMLAQLDKETERSRRAT